MTHLHPTTDGTQPQEHKTEAAPLLRVGITHGDFNGVGYEVILKTFSDPTMMELCTPIVYGSPKVAAYHRKAMDIQTNFSIINQASDAQDGRLNILNCTDDELKVELGKPSAEAGKAALDALERALIDYREGRIDVLVTAPINKHSIQSDSFHFPGHTEYIEQRVGEGNTALMILMQGDLRVALVTGHVPVRFIAKEITREHIAEKLQVFHQSLKRDFNIDSPRIAVLALNPHAGDEGLLGTEEQEIIIPTMQDAIKQGIQCFGPYPADGFFGSGNYRHFDGILAMYHDQGLAPFKALAMDEGVNYTAGLPIVRTSPAHGTAYDIAGQGVASEDSFRQAIYVAIDVYRNRQRDDEMHAHPLRKQYYEKRDDSDKLKLDTVDDENI
jgi:4-hydroxythreonine-4-phosphate dehydrogenase